MSATAEGRVEPPLDRRGRRPDRRTRPGADRARLARLAAGEELSIVGQVRQVGGSARVLEEHAVGRPARPHLLSTRTLIGSR